MKHYTTLRLFAAVLFLYPLCLSAQWNQTNGPEGGGISALIRHQNTLWAAANGLYYSNDEGETWTFHDAFHRDHLVLSIHIHNDALFAFIRVSGVGPQGYENHIYRSLDAGQTWTMISKIPFSYVFSVYHFTSIQGNLLLMHTSRGYRSSDGGLSWQEISFLVAHPGRLAYDSTTILMRSHSEGMFISSDVGDTWQQIADSAAMFTNVHCIKDSVILAESYATGGHRYVITKNLGQTWEEMQIPLPLNASYLLFYSGPGNTLFCKSDKLYWTTDLGANWHYWGSTMAEGHAISPSVFLSDGAIGYRSDGIWRYKTATDEWTSANNGMVNSFVSQLFSIGQTLFASTPNGLYGTVDAGMHWNQAPQPPSASGYQYALSGDTLFVMAYRTLYTYPYNSPLGWDTLANEIGAGNPTNFSLQGDNLVWIGRDDIFLINRYSGVKNTVIPPAGASHSNNFLHINDDRYIYSDNSGNIYISDNKGVSWQQTLVQSTAGNNQGNNLFYHLGRHFFSNRKGLRMSTDNGASWSDVIPNSPQNSISMVNLEDLLFLAVGGPGVLVSQDSGLTWQPYNTGLSTFSGQVLSVFQDQLFLGTVNHGVWRCAPNLTLISGTVYNDVNNNGLRDAGETPHPNAIIQTRPNGVYTVSRADGSYFLYTNNAADTVSVTPASSYITINPPFRLISQGGSLNFGVYSQPDVPDLEVSLVNIQRFKPGFPSSLMVTCRNKGTIPQRPLLNMIFQPPFQYVHSSIFPDSIDGSDTYLWELDTLQPNQTKKLLVTGYISPSSMIGDSIIIAAHIRPESTDQTPTDNMAWLRTTVVGAYDPNDKQANPADRITPAQISAGEPIVYTIRFQNTGNHPATFVRIVDTLSTYFDISSLRVLSASHDFTWTLRDAGVLEFFFDDIQLPDSASNPVASNGFVQYSIRPRPKFVLNTPLRNRAFIYFDFNTPVETNTTNTVVSWPLVTHQVPSTLPLQIAPNPATQQINITRIQEHPTLLRILDVSGREVWQNWVTGYQISIPVAALPQGLYQIFLSNNTILEHGKFVIHR